MQFSDVVDDQLVVKHSDIPSLAVDVTSVVKKLRPSTVIPRPDVIGALLTQ
jgi:hypothetical protein